MSQPKRYRLNPVLVWLPGADIVGIDNIREVTHASMECKEDEGGTWVLHSDYAALAAELERMRSEHEVGFSSVVLKKWAAEHAALAAENERLRKAGDAMAHWIDHQYHKDGYPFVEAWDAAKEGGAK